MNRPFLLDDCCSLTKEIRLALDYETSALLRSPSNTFEKYGLWAKKNMRTTGSGYDFVVNMVLSYYNFETLKFKVLVFYYCWYVYIWSRSTVSNSVNNSKCCYAYTKI